MASQTRMLPQSVDILVVGGGPIALITTYILLKNGLKVLTVEQHDRARQAMYGRSSAIYSRSLEYLDMLGMYERLSDTGFILRGAQTIKDGKVVPMGGWHFIQEAIDGNTFYDFCMAIRQKYVEDALAEGVRELDPDVIQALVKLVDYRVEQTAEYPVTSLLQLKGGSKVQVKSKWLVGADGGRSTVRALSKIPFPGVQSPHKWVRLDAIVKTDMPASRKTVVAIVSPQHGNVLWLPEDNGRTRIGFVISDELYGKDGSGVNAEIIMQEAKKALLPNTLEFVHLDWWIVYAIGQRIAETYRNGAVLLVGDSAHTHSSGSPQGMNTGIHDSTNLAWKLAGVAQGWYEDSVLDTYTTERRASAQQLIELDKDISALISGKIPDHFNAPAGADVNQYLDKVFRENAGFQVGLGISYAENILNKASAFGSVAPGVTVGHRAPDASLFRSGAAFPSRLQQLANTHVTRFTILLFAGDLCPDRHGDGLKLNPKTAAKYIGLREYVNSSSSFTSTLADVFTFLTIIRGEGVYQPAETIAALPLGKVAYDRSGEAYTKYGVDLREGAIVVLRPDQIVGFVAPLNGWTAVGQYFGAFVRPGKTTRHIAAQDAAFAVGELSIEGQEESTQESKARL